MFSYEEHPTVCYKDCADSILHIYHMGQGGKQAPPSTTLVLKHSINQYTFSNFMQFVSILLCSKFFFKHHFYFFYIYYSIEKE